MFVTIGPIKSCRVMRDYKTGYSYGFGFVEYQKQEDAANAITTLNGFQLQNKRIKVAYARPPGQESKNTNLYIQNLPRDMTDERLEAMFSPFGTIVQKNLLRDKYTGLLRGVAFVRYEKKGDADTAIEAMNGAVPDAGTESLLVKVAEEHGRQKVAFYAGWQMGRGGGRGGGGFRTPPGMMGTGDFHHPVGPDRGYNPPPLMGRGYDQGFGGAMRQDRSNNRYNPIGMGGGYSNMYNWN